MGMNKYIQLARRIGILVLLTYVGVLAAMYFLQHALIFRDGSGRPVLAKTGLAMQEIAVPVVADAACWQNPSPSVCAIDTVDLLTWYAPPPKPDAPTILYLHGNGGHIGLRRGIARQFLAAGFGLLMLEYRGYGGNPGSATADGLSLDAMAGWNYLRAQNINPAQIFIYGESIGGAVAIQMLHDRPAIQPGGLILYAPFTALRDVVAFLYPWLPVDLLLRYEFDSIGKIAALRAPLLVMHGGQDEFVPQRMGEAIYNAATSPKELWIEPGANHYTLWEMGAVQRAVEFIRSTSRGEIGGSQ
jgi:uncharacterized protein